eukprot:TRINITY_DN20101_c0_g1_i3.p1 TRINITY_DN20101_c0_g1~~TRINITY_DN20101_c0_g1_i3.p1  ORF type:complete len:400 (+),score=28.99 TRINITY_DN20101_c0_g1_i3:41-1201(+)
MASSLAKQRWQKLRGIHAAVRLRRSVYVPLPLPLSDICLACANLDDLDSCRDGEQTIRQLVQRCQSQPFPVIAKDEPSFWPIAIISIVLAVMCVVPYSNLLIGDPGCPLLITFALHAGIVTIYLPKASTLLMYRKIPVRYHAGMIACGSLFALLKADSLLRIPAPVSMLLSNIQMVLGVLVQFALTGKRYSRSQILGVVMVTAGVLYAGHAMQHTTDAGEEVNFNMDYLIGVFEMLIASLAVVILGHLLKVTFAQFGENVEEQVFIQHLFVMLIIFPMQWDKIGPRLAAWRERGDMWLIGNLAVCITLNIAGRAASVVTAGRAHNLLMTQLVHTIEHFLQLLTIALLRVPPWPPSGFWSGTIILALGTAQYLRASKVPTQTKDDSP